MTGQRRGLVAPSLAGDSGRNLGRSGVGAKALVLGKNNNRIGFGSFSRKDVT